MERVPKIALYLIIIDTLVSVPMILNEKGLPLLQTDLTHLSSLHYYEVPSFHRWQYFSYMSMRGGIFHLLFNMYALRAFGTPLENIWGRNKSLLFYFFCGIGMASLRTGVDYYYVHQAVNALAEAGIPAEEIVGLIREGKYSPEWDNVINYSTYKSIYDTFTSYTIGASEAVYGVLAAFAVSFPNAKLILFFVPYPIAVRCLTPIIVALDLFSGVTGTPIFGGDIARFAHVGGVLADFLIILF